MSKEITSLWTKTQKRGRVLGLRHQEIFPAGGLCSWHLRIGKLNGSTILEINILSYDEHIF